MKATVVHAITLAALLGSPAAPESMAAEIRDFTLADQHGTTRVYRFPKQKVTLMTLADWKGSEQLEPWIQRIHDRYGKRIDIDGVADMSAVPRPLRPMVQGAFKKKLTYSVMLDWAGPVVRQFPAKAGVANVYVIARSGRIVAHRFGKVSDPEAQALFAEIDRAMAAD